MKVENRDVFREPFVRYNVNLGDVVTSYLDSLGLYSFEDPVFSFDYKVPFISIDCNYKYHFISINGVSNDYYNFLMFSLLLDFTGIQDNCSYFVVLHYNFHLQYYRKVDIMFTREVYFMGEKVKKICIDVNKFFDVLHITVKNGDIYVERIKLLILFPFSALFHINLPDKIVFSDIYFLNHGKCEVNMVLNWFFDVSNFDINKHYFINKNIYLSNYVGKFSGLAFFY